MKIYEIICEAKTIVEGARIQHAEDLVFFEGSAGALRALNNIAGLTKSRDALSIKWDGCIHPESVLQTDRGELTINEVIDMVNLGNALSVLGCDLNSNANVMVQVAAAVKSTGPKNWVEIVLENGDLMRVTEDHEIFTTNRGWVPAGELTDADDIKEL